MAVKPEKPNKNSDPPKCKTCGKREWRHTCGKVLRRSGDGVALVSSAHPTPKRPKGAPEDISPGALETIPMPLSLAVEVARLGPEEIARRKAERRKEYLRDKARERRAREKSAKMERADE